VLKRLQDLGTKFPAEKNNRSGFPPTVTKIRITLDTPPLYTAGEKIMPRKICPLNRWPFPEKYVIVAKLLITATITATITANQADKGMQA
jgi:hypothetical protein